MRPRTGNLTHACVLAGSQPPQYKQTRPCSSRNILVLSACGISSPLKLYPGRTENRPLQQIKKRGVPADKQILMRHLDYPISHRASSALRLSDSVNLTLIRLQLKPRRFGSLYSPSFSALPKSPNVALFDLPPSSSSHS
jgi:hypothetical protein